jgi:uncharacterized SAM-binding protein YcdF (DUF218 family)
MSQALASAVSVTGLLVGLLAGVVWLCARPSSRAPRRWLTAVLVIYLGFSVHGIGTITSWPLRRGFSPFSVADVPPGRGAIVLLSAGSRNVHGRDADKISVLNLAGAARVIEAARVFRTMDSPWLVSSGGAAAGRDMAPESETMKTALIQLGVPADRILLESTSRSTRDQAVLTAAMLRNLGISSFVLVTSDVHMRRALATFRHEGLQPVPAVARDPLDSQWIGLEWLPTQQGMEFAQEIAHEYVGLAWYKVRGWI